MADDHPQSLDRTDHWVLYLLDVCYLSLSCYCSFNIYQLRKSHRLKKNKMLAAFYGIALITLLCKK